MNSVASFSSMLYIFSIVLCLIFPRFVFSQETVSADAENDWLDSVYTDKDALSESVMRYEERKNENRSGIRFSAEYTLGKVVPYLFDPVNDIYEKDTLFTHWDDSIDNIEESELLKSSRRMISFATRFEFIIKAGPHFIATCGPGASIMYKSWYTYDQDLAHHKPKLRRFFFFLTPYLTSEFAFVRRWYPLKITAGAFMDINFNLTHYHYEYASNEIMSEKNKEFTNRDFSVTIAGGPHAGIEILRDTGLGIGLDIFYRFSRINAELSLSDNPGNTAQWQFRMPSFGAALSFNFYYQ